MEQDNMGRVVGVILGKSNPSTGQRQGRPASTPHPLRLVARPDRDQQRLIENGLAVAALRGHNAAIDYLVAAKVPLRTISRVLWQPQQRRSFAT
jgi:hypothetical protein